MKNLLCFLNQSLLEFENERGKKASFGSVYVQFMLRVLWAAASLCLFFFFPFTPPLSFSFHTLPGECFLSLWYVTVWLSELRVFLVLSEHTGEEAFFALGTF